MNSRRGLGGGGVDKKMKINKPLTAKTPRVYLYIVMFSFDIRIQMLMFTKLIVLEVDTMTLLSVKSLRWISRIPDHTTQRK